MEQWWIKWNGTIKQRIMEEDKWERDQMKRQTMKKPQNDRFVILKLMLMGLNWTVCMCACVRVCVCACFGSKYTWVERHTTSPQVHVPSSSPISKNKPKCQDKELANIHNSVTHAHAHTHLLLFPGRKGKSWKKKNERILYDETVPLLLAAHDVFSFSEFEENVHIFWLLEFVFFTNCVCIGKPVPPYMCDKAFTQKCTSWDVLKHVCYFPPLFYCSSGDVLYWGCCNAFLMFHSTLTHSGIQQFILPK